VDVLLTDADEPPSQWTGATSPCSLDFVTPAEHLAEGPRTRHLTRRSQADQAGEGLHMARSHIFDRSI
jgi:hypothetical protein